MPDSPLPPDTNPETTIFYTRPAALSTIGPYQLIERLGEGGMGEVWLAEQRHPVRRRVALKLIKAGMNSREVVARFESERQALALMNHPSIAKVFDAGATRDGLPYFAMEYVAGEPITEFCDKRRLNMRERLELFIQVCQGVQHAHQKAILHRDLKPSNILVTLVDEKPVPKIIDFGVAKAVSQSLTANTLFTRAGALIGTPAYMSPEQANSGGEDIDTRTDVYSLGVVLYELLVGALPLDLTGIRNLAFHELLRRIREEDAPRPSTKIKTSGEHSSLAARNRRTDPALLGKQLKGDLDSIALKALEKERGRRYGSPSDLASDLERYLRNEPVLAVRPSLAYHVRKFVRRHRLGVAASAAVALCLVALVVSVLVDSVRIARERDRANREAQAAERVANFLVDAFKVSDPGEARGNKLTAREVLDKGAQKIESSLAGEPQLQTRLMLTIASVYQELGLYEPARQLVERALKLQSKVLGPDDPATLRSQRLLARLLQYQAHYDAAEKLYRATLARQEQLLGANHPEAIRTGTSLGQLAAQQGRYAEAEKILLRTSAASEKAFGPDHPDTLSALHGLAVAYDGTQQYAKEETLWRELFQRRLRTLGPDHPDTLDTEQNLAYVYYREGKLPEAEKLQREALEIEKRIQGPDHPSVVLAMGNLANTLSEEHRYREAEALQRESLALRKKTLGTDHPETLFALANLGNIVAAQKRYPEALAMLREALAGETRVLGDKHPEVAYAWFNLATAEAAAGNHAEALRDLRQAVNRGYAQPQEIAESSAWAGLHNDPQYVQLLAQITRAASAKN